MKNLLAIYCILLLVYQIGYSQEYEFGEVSEEEMKLASFPADPEADAVVLCDIGEISITKSWKSFPFCRYKSVSRILHQKDVPINFVLDIID